MMVPGSQPVPLSWIFLPCQSLCLCLKCSSASSLKQSQILKKQFKILVFCEGNPCVWFKGKGQYLRDENGRGEAQKGPRGLTVQ